MAYKARVSFRRLRIRPFGRQMLLRSCIGMSLEEPVSADLPPGFIQALSPTGGSNDDSELDNFFL